MAGYDDVLEQDDINELISLRDSTTSAQFRVGDMAVRYADRAKYFGVTKQFMYSAIGSFYGKASRTIRGYEVVARYYPKTIRELYPVLSFDHFKVAMRHANPIDVLEWAIISLDGRPQTVDACIAKFAIPAEREIDSIDNVLQPIRGYVSRLPGFIRERIEKLLDEIEELIKEGAVV